MSALAPKQTGPSRHGSPGSSESLVLAEVADREVREVASSLLDERVDDGLVVCASDFPSGQSINPARGAASRRFLTESDEEDLAQLLDTVRKQQLSASSEPKPERLGGGLDGLAEGDERVPDDGPAADAEQRFRQVERQGTEAGAYVPT